MPSAVPAVRGPLVLGLLLLMVFGSGCRREPPAIEGAPTEPVAAVQALAGALREGDLAHYARLSVPPAMQAEQAMLWQQAPAGRAVLDPAEAERWREWMAQLTAPDAEARLWARIEPRLQDLEQQAGPSWAVVIGMLGGFASAAITADTTLNPAQKAHAKRLVEVVSHWAREPTHFTDRARAQAAIAVVVRTARALQLPDPEALQALDREAALAKGSIALQGGKALAAIYGIDIDAALARVEARVIALDGDQATLEVGYLLLDQFIAFEQPMVRIDGGWYRVEAIEAHRRAMAMLPAPAPAPAPAATP